MTRDDLLNRLMRHDMDAYLEMTDKYSWNVYSLIKSRISDKNKAELIYNETMNGFFQGLSGTKGNDALEALLLMYADKVCQANMGESDAAVVGKPESGKCKTVSGVDAAEKKGGFLYHICVWLLILAIVLVIWVILGLLMDMNLIPYYELGYTWFNTNVLPWF